MKVKDLIAQLGQFNQDAEVAIVVGDEEGNTMQVGFDMIRTGEIEMLISLLERESIEVYDPNTVYLFGGVPDYFDALPVMDGEDFLAKNHGWYDKLEAFSENVYPNLPKFGEAPLQRVVEELFSEAGLTKSYEEIFTELNKIFTDQFVESIQAAINSESQNAIILYDLFVWEYEDDDFAPRCDYILYVKEGMTLEDVQKIVASHIPESCKADWIAAQIVIEANHNFEVSEGAISETTNYHELELNVYLREASN